MWDMVGIVAAVVVILLLLQLLDVSETLKARLKGGSTSRELEGRVADLEARLETLEKR
jgi:hypothetical protein